MIAATAVSVVLSGKHGAALAEAVEEPWEPAGPLVWIGDVLYWIAARSKGSGVDYALIASSEDGSADRRVWEMPQPAYCFAGGGSVLHVLATDGGGSVRFGTVDRFQEVLDDVADSYATLTACQKRLALRAQAFRARTGQRVWALDDSPGGDALLCLQGADGSSRLVRLRGEEATELAVTDVPLALHNSRIEWQPHGGGFLAWPSLTFDDRRTLAAELPGWPVLRISDDGSVDRIDVPWAPWNALGAFRPVLASGGLMVAASPDPRKTEVPLGGLYSQQHGWERVAASDIETANLAIRADGRLLAWPSRAPSGSRPRLRLEYFRNA